MTSTHTEHSPTGSKAAAISNHVVRTISDYTGRGPTKARTYLNEDVVVCVLQDTLTKGERSLVTDSLDDLVLTMRKAFQDTMREALVAGIEEILGRTVTAFMSANHIDPDAAVEVFLLEPNASASRNDRGRHDGAKGDGANHGGANHAGANHAGANHGGAD